MAAARLAPSKPARQPLWPSTRSSFIIPTGVQTQGVPQAIASTVTRGPPSQVDAHTRARERR